MRGDNHPLINMKKPQEILKALSLLDPTNDEHWTVDGQPQIQALGLEGIKRSDIRAAAPLFNRSNAELPKVEEEPSLEDRLLEIELAKEEAQKALLDAVSAKQAAEAAAKAAENRLESLRSEVKAMDTRSDTEINQELLKSNFAQRLKDRGAWLEAHQYLQEKGLASQIKSLTASPVDQAISQRIIMERRKASKKVR